MDPRRPRDGGTLIVGDRIYSADRASWVRAICHVLNIRHCSLAHAPNGGGVLSPMALYISLPLKADAPIGSRGTFRYPPFFPHPSFV